jgi:hypothetical protein
VRECLAVILVLAGAAVVPADEPQSLIEMVWVLDPSGTKCLTCPDGVVPDEVRSVVEASDLVSFRTWIHDRFSYGHEDMATSRPSDPSGDRFSFWMDLGGGVRFQERGFSVHYEQFRCWLWDCYKPRMWRIDGSGARVWKRKVPFAVAPVEPFVVGDFILYIGGYTKVEELVILDVDTGRVVETFAPAGEERGFWDSALMVFPPFYVDGYIYLKGTSHNQFNPVTRKPVSESPAKTYVLKVRF